MIFKSKQHELHSRYYWILLGVSLLIGIPAAFGIYNVISDNVTGRTRIPIYLLLIPLMLLLALAKWIDAMIVKAAPQLVRERDRAALTESLGYDPVSGQSAGSVASVHPSAAGYGQPPVSPPAGGGSYGAQYGGGQPPASYGH